MLTNLKAEKAKIQAPANLVSGEEPVLMDGIFYVCTLWWMDQTSLRSLYKGSNSICKDSPS